MVGTNNSVLGKWSDFLPDTIVSLGYNLYNRANGLRKTVTVYPEQGNIFRIFNAINPLEVKVVILGQDPYHDGNATGVAFGCKKTLSPSLKQIWDSIKNTTPQEYEGDVNPSLEHLVEQGVFLLNTILTVEEGKAMSHKYMYWENFTSSVIKHLSDKRQNIVFMLWGSHAQKYRRYIDTNKHCILEDTHPQYANYQDKKWNCTNFAECNLYLEQNNIKPIMWR